MATTAEEGPAPDAVDGPETSGAPATRRSLLAIGVIAGLGLVARAAYALIEFHGDSNLFDEGDAFLYSAVSTNTATGEWFTNPFDGSHFADHPPLTVAVLTPTSWLFPENVMAQRLTMAVLGSIAVVLIGLFARSLVGGVGGVAAAAVAALNPNLWMNDALVMSEAVSAALITALLWASVALGRDPTRRRAAATGALCGLTILARAEIGLFLPLLIVPTIALARSVPGRERVLRAGLALVAAAAVVLPWTAWNATQYEDPVLISTNDGTTILGANCPETYSTGIVGGWSLRCVLELNESDAVDGRGLDASEVSGVQRKAGITYVRDHLGRVPAVVMARMGRTFGFWGVDQQVFANTGEGRPRWASWAGYAAFWALVPVSLFGAWTLRIRRVSLLPAAATLATVVIVSTLFYGIARFRLPLDVMTCVLAGAAVAGLGPRLGPRARGVLSRWDRPPTTADPEPRGAPTR